MRIYRSVLAVIGSMGLASLGTTAYAGGCGYGASAQKCQPGVVVHPGTAPVFDPMTVSIKQPLGHLRSVHFNRAPNVSITRVHAMGPTASLEDAPSGFTKGCHPTSTQYCRSGAGTPVHVELSQPPLVHAPVVARPMVQHVPAPRVVYTGQGFDPSKFQPRQYGTNDFTPGIAHVPTSYVDRSPARAQHALNASGAGGIAPGQGGPLVAQTPTAAIPGYVHTAHVAGNRSGYGYGVARHNVAPRGIVSAPAPVVQYAPTLPTTHYAAPAPVLAPTGHATAPVQTSTGLYASNVGADGTYWEKASGPTFFGDTLATQVICKRKLPQRTHNPVVGVPEPVCVNPQAHAAHGARHQGAPVLAGGPASRWSY